MNNLSAIQMLILREIIRFYRQPSRIVGALGTPLIFWGFIGSGVGETFRSSQMPEGMTYLEYLYPGTLVLIVLFTSIFSNISLIDDRNAGFLQSVLVAPVSRISVVVGKVLGGALLATSQATLFLLLAPAAGLELSLHSGAGVIGASFLVSVCLSAVGFVFAWRLESVQGFHAVMNLVLFPMWLLSGALFPFMSAPHILQWMNKLNPLSYGYGLIQHAFYQGSAFEPVILAGRGVCLGVITLFGLGFVFYAGLQAKGELK